MNWFKEKLVKLFLRENNIIRERFRKPPIQTSSYVRWLSFVVAVITSLNQLSDFNILAGMSILYKKAMLVYFYIQFKQYTVLDKLDSESRHALI